MPRMRHRDLQSTPQLPRTDRMANGASTIPPVRARTVTAAAGLQPASRSGLMNAPDMPNVAAEITAITRPTEVDERFMLSPWLGVLMGCDYDASLATGKESICILPLTPRTPSTSPWPSST